MKERFNSYTCIMRSITRSLVFGVCDLVLNQLTSKLLGCSLIFTKLYITKAEIYL